MQTAYQNTSVATAVALNLFEGRERARAVSVPVGYGVASAVLIGGYCVAGWKAGWTYAPASDPLCDVLRKSYQEEADGEANATKWSVENRAEALDAPRRAPRAADDGESPATPPPSLTPRALAPPSLELDDAARADEGARARASSGAGLIADGDGLEARDGTADAALYDPVIA